MATLSRKGWPPKRQKTQRPADNVPVISTPRGTKSRKDLLATGVKTRQREGMMRDARIDCFTLFCLTIIVLQFIRHFHL